MGRSDNALGDLWNVNKVTIVLFSIDSLCVWKLGNPMAFGGDGGGCGGGGRHRILEETTGMQVFGG